MKKIIIALLLLAIPSVCFGFFGTHQIGGRRTLISEEEAVDSDGETYGQWALIGGASKSAIMVDGLYNNFIQETTDTEKQGFDTTDLTTITTVSSIKVCAECWYTSADGTIRMLFNDGASDTFSANVTVTGSSDVTRTTVCGTVYGSWSAATFNGGEIGIELVSAGGGVDVSEIPSVTVYGY